MNANDTTFNNVLTLLGRILIAALFVPAGLAKIAGFAGTTGYIASVGLPLPQVGAAIAVAVEVGFGLMVLVGWRSRLAALGMAVFTVIAGALFHNFWAAAADQMQMQQINFFKNLSLAGGLLFIAAFGPGAWSLDARASASASRN
jgi:putative oxidoreductase